MPTATLTTLQEAVLNEALTGLTASPKTLTPWLFYDERGSQLFEEITQLPEYYVTRTERAILAAHAAEILETASQGARLTLIELGAGTATKTGLLLEAAVERQGSVLYQPIDVSASALDEAAASIAAHIPNVVVESQVANYTSEPFTLTRHPGERALALYIGSSIGNFSSAEAKNILRNLRDHLAPGDFLLLGTDLAPGPTNPSLRSKPLTTMPKASQPLSTSTSSPASTTTSVPAFISTTLPTELSGTPLAPASKCISRASQIKPSRSAPTASPSPRARPSTPKTATSSPRAPSKLYWTPAASSAPTPGTTRIADLP
jgi:hypothetical protein